MNAENDGQAMTEVALGLAMAFFAMMILAMMSMSMPQDLVAKQATFKQGINVVANSKATSNGKSASQELPENAADENNADNVKNSGENIIIFYQGRYLDVALQPLNIATLDTTKRYILAFSPDLSLSDVLTARTQISSPNLTITELDEAWLTRLAL